jgi:hypothetical protein
MLTGVVLLLLMAVCNEVVRCTTLEASLLLSSAARVLAVVVEPLELVDHQCQLAISKHLNLLLSDRHQRRQSKQSKGGVSIRSSRSGHKCHGRRRWVLYFGSRLEVYLCGLELAKQLIDGEGFIIGGLDDCYNFEPPKL